MIRKLVIITLTPFCLFIGVLGCADFTARTIVAGLTPLPRLCLKGEPLPERPCLLQTATERYTCSRSLGGCQALLPTVKP